MLRHERMLRIPTLVEYRMRADSLGNRKALNGTLAAWLALCANMVVAMECIPVDPAKLTERTRASSVLFEPTFSVSCSGHKNSTAPRFSEGEISAAADGIQPERTRCRASLRSFCNELKTAQFNVPSGKEWMPTVPGLTPRAIKVKRNHITLHYTFK